VTPCSLGGHVTKIVGRNCCFQRQYSAMKVTSPTDTLVSTYQMIRPHTRLFASVAWSYLCSQRSTKFPKFQKPPQDSKHHLWKDFLTRETGAGQQVAQLRDRNMMMMMMMTTYNIWTPAAAANWRYFYAEPGTAFRPTFETSTSRIGSGSAKHAFLHSTLRGDGTSTCRGLTWLPAGSCTEVDPTNQDTLSII
jgi:hypothetical protein